MAKLSTDELLEAFKEMTLIELSEFVKQFEDTFNVTAAAPSASVVTAVTVVIVGRGGRGIRGLALLGVVPAIVAVVAGIAAASTTGCQQRNERDEDHGSGPPHRSILRMRPELRRRASARRGPDWRDGAPPLAPASRGRPCARV